MFEPDELERLVPRARGGPRLAEVNGAGAGGLDPIAATEAIAYDFLAKGGKYSRPFITLAAYDALTGGNCTQPDGADSRCRSAHRRRAPRGDVDRIVPQGLARSRRHPGRRRIPLRPADAAHRARRADRDQRGRLSDRPGLPAVSRDTTNVGADTAADILNKLADAHTKLSEGQGAELVWRDSRDKRLSPAEALKIYALKTAPAFEAALYCGLRLAGPAEQYAEPVAQFAKHLGIAFQILNDLQDWQGDDFNKLTLGGDVLGGRPTVLWALALEGLEDDDRRELEQLVAEGEATPAVFEQIRRLFQQAGAFDESAATGRRASPARRSAWPTTLRRRPSAAWPTT